MNLPVDFINSLNNLPYDHVKHLIDSFDDEVPVSIHINPDKISRNTLRFSSDVERVAWCENGYYLPSRPSFTFDPMFHSGMYYVQEASSMFVEHIVRQLIKEPATCLDMCAAPGGKSVGMLSALSKGSVLVSNEIIRTRANILGETISKFGCSSVIVTNNAPSDYSGLSSAFDLILVDAPCSGEGMFRKDEVAIKEWSLEAVDRCAKRQREILADAWKALKPGGILIYSTCTFNVKENEDNMRWLAGEKSLEYLDIYYDKGWGISPSLYDDVKAYRFFPNSTKGEGLFVSVVRKLDDDGTAYNIYNDKKKNKAMGLLKDSGRFGKYLLNSEEFDFIQKKNKIIAIPNQLLHLYMCMDDRFSVIHSGINIGEIKGDNYIPSQELAISQELDLGSFDSHELSFVEALAYLRGESISIEGADKGYVIVKYMNEPIGFVKNLGFRANNLYPKEWRIRSTYLPEGVESIFSN